MKRRRKRAAQYYGPETLPPINPVTSQELVKIVNEAASNRLRGSLEEKPVHVYDLCCHYTCGLASMSAA